VSSSATHDSSSSDVPVRSEQDKLPYEVVEYDILDLLELNGCHGVRRRGWGRRRKRDERSLEEAKASRGRILKGYSLVSGTISLGEARGRC